MVLFHFIVSVALAALLRALIKAFYSFSIYSTTSFILGMIIGVISSCLAIVSGGSILVCMADK